ncbi:MAG: hypothetical protein B7X02_00155 [Rhodospirillales bacterium 12-54-5]|nr:MAG: hypothetical protein B7X02_00155 [Rhodospirillales bacterium 12-54-5]
MLYGCTPKEASSAAKAPLPSVAGRSIAVVGAQPFTPPINNVKLTGLPQTPMLPPKVKGAPVVIKTVRVGLLIPLTGRNAVLGRAMQDAATIALYDKYSNLPMDNDTRVELLPKDTGDAPEQAAQAMNAAIADGAQFIIGPVFADATEVAAPIARANNLSLLSFSNNLASPGQGIYAFGFSPQEQTQRIMDYAIRKGKTRIAALVPNSSLGTTVLATGKAVLAQHQQDFVATAMYAPQGLGIDAAVRQLVPENTMPNFDALLLPEGGAALNTILRTLAAHGVTTKNVQFLGTGIWDDAALVRRVPLDGAWLASSPPESTTMFETRFRKTFNYAPPRVASLAYDAVSLAVTLATTGRGFDGATLIQHSGFTGPANGMFRLHGDGKTERGLAVLQIDGTVFNVIAPPPTAFSAE